VPDFSSTSPVPPDACLADTMLSPRLWSHLHVGPRRTTLHHQRLDTKLREVGPDLVRPRFAARGRLRGARVDDPGTSRLADPGRPTRRADAERPGGAERARPHRQGGPRAETLGAAQPRRGGRVAK